MAKKTNISWTDSTFNPWIGCTKVGPGCDHCYAAVSTPARTMGIAWGAGQPRRRTAQSNWQQPTAWNREHQVFAALHGHRRRRVFCASLADWLDKDVAIDWLADLLALVHDTPHLDWLLLTKRIGNWRARMLDVQGYLDGLKGAAVRHGLRRSVANWLDGEAPGNVWLGATVVNHDEYIRDVHKLLKVPAAVRFLSVEPMLGPISTTPTTLQRLDWVICGGESGPAARPMAPGWVGSLRLQCQEADTPFFFKQWGGASPDAGGCELDGRECKAWPRVIGPDLRGVEAAGLAP